MGTRPPRPPEDPRYERPDADMVDAADRMPTLELDPKTGELREKPGRPKPK
jgi:hypothetical protein